MKNQVILLFCFLFSANCIGQSTLEKGYYLDLDGIRVECFHRHQTWKYNPDHLECQFEKSDPFQWIEMDLVDEFGLENKFKYQKHTVEIDQSPSNLKRLSKKRSPEFKTETVFLKLLVEGEKASLYGYTKPNMERYFYQVESGKIEQLIFKQFRDAKNYVNTNNAFKQQLFNSLNCDNSESAEDLKFERADLVAYFSNYNKCKGGNYINYIKPKELNLFKVTPRLGLRRSSLATTFEIFENKNFETNDITSIQFGLEGEFAFSSFKKRLALLIEPTFQYLNFDGPANLNEVEVAYISVEFQIGLRYYLKLNEKARLFLNGSLVADVDFNSTINYLNLDSYDIGNSMGASAGVGIKVNNLSFELRGHTSRDLLNKIDSAGSRFNAFSMIFGYTLFKL